VGNIRLLADLGRRVAIAVVVQFAIFQGIAIAQTAAGRVVGTISDPSGSVVPGVRVAVVNTDTKTIRDTQTNQDGYFQVIDLPIGNYRVEAEAPGFRKLQTETKTLQINQALRFDMTLEVGQTTETVMVEANAGGVETVNVTLGLAFVRTSPDHGTALDIAGTGTANPSSLAAALRLAAELRRNEASSEARSPARPRTSG